MVPSQWVTNRGAGGRQHRPAFVRPAPPAPASHECCYGCPASVRAPLRRRRPPARNPVDVGEQRRGDGFHHGDPASQSPQKGYDIALHSGVATRSVPHHAGLRSRLAPNPRWPTRCCASAEHQFIESSKGAEDSQRHQMDESASASPTSSATPLSSSASPTSCAARLSSTASPSSCATRLW